MQFEDVVFLLEEKLEILTEEQLEFLVENRVQFIKDANLNKITAEHDPESADKGSNAIVDHIASKIDPTKNKAHTQWLVNRYKAGDFKLSDSKDVKKTMKDYEDAKPYLDSKDLGSMKSLAHLKDSIATTTGRQKLEADKAKEDSVHDLPEIYSSDSGVKAYKVPNKATSIRMYGPNGKLAKTRWCTAAEGASNAFNSYSGGKYTIHTPEGNVAQLHHQSDQFMDSDDKPIDVKKDSRFSKYRREISDVMKKTNSLENHPASKILANNAILTHADAQKAFDEHDAAINDIKNSTYSYTTHAQSTRAVTTFEHLTHVIQKAPLTDEQIDRIKNIPRVSRFSDSIEDVDMSHQYVANTEAKPEQLDSIADHAIAHDHPLEELYRNPNTSANTQHKIIGHLLAKYNHSDNPSKLQHFAMNATNLQPEHFERIEHVSKIKESATVNRNAKLPQRYLDELKDTHPANVIAHPQVTKDIAYHHLNSDDKQTVAGAINSGLVEPDDVLKRVRESRGLTIDGRKFIEDPRTSDAHISELLTHARDKNKVNLGHGAVTSTRLTREHISSLVKRPDIIKRENILNNPKLKAGDLDDIIKNTSTGHFDKPYNVKPILDNPAATHKTIDSLLSDEGNRNAVHKVILGDGEEDPKDYATPQHLHDIIDAASSELSDKHRVLFHPSVQLSHFEKLKNDKRMHGAISKSKNAPPSILHSLATSSMDHVRHNVAENPNTERKTLEILKTDSNPTIAAIASKKVK